MSITAKEIFEKMPGKFNAEKAKGINATIQFNLSGEGGGVWSLKAADGKCAIEEKAIDSPTLTFNMDAGDYVAMVTGELKPMAAFMQGKIKLQGDMGLAMKFQGLFDG